MAEYTCEQCPCTYSNKKSLGCHVRAMHSVTLRDWLRNRCHTCGKRFSRAFDAQRHVRQVHNKEGRIKCQYCDRDFVRNWDLQAASATQPHNRLSNGKWCHFVFNCQTVQERFVTVSVGKMSIFSINNQGRGIECEGDLSPEETKVLREWFEEGVKSLEASSFLDTCMSYGIVTSENSNMVNSRPMKKEKARYTFNHILVKDKEFKAYRDYLRRNECFAYISFMKKLQEAGLYKPSQLDEPRRVSEVTRDDKKCIPDPVPVRRQKRAYPFLKLNRPHLLIRHRKILGRLFGYQGTRGAQKAFLHVC